ncbi:MAG: ABC transporter permease subunit [Erysipelothrix sp.]|jgi:glycine betaine/proline transport system permease protein/glycine betaine/proline transport system substrate-binding protein|nr:ABC transporter permease subunit [Erysipelothrix sp.]
MNWIYEFPFQLTIDTSAIDKGVRSFALTFDSVLRVIRQGLTTTLLTIYDLLTFIPWWVLVLIVIGLYFKQSKKIGMSLLYGGLLALIGFTGLWTLMLSTLSIVITAVILSVLFGFPFGLLLSLSERANKIMRPVLDTMQTMPVFVYLIPAMLLFGLGRVPAVMATVIYAIVPIIRLTNLGIRQVNHEIVEASRSFGATTIQTLIKVQIPQAFTTIMAGLNQTLMMAMAMVVTASMIGAPGLGMEVLISVNRIEVGRGLVSGTAIVIVAIILDRLSQGWVKPQTEEESL